MSTERTTYTARVAPWEHGYELHIAGVGVTQATSLEDFEEVARDFIAADLDVPAESFDLTITEGAA